MKEQGFIELGRRQFLKQAAVFAVALPALPLGCAALSSTEATKCIETTKPAAAPAQDWAGAADAPPNVSWKTKIVAAGEPGEPLLVSGTIFQPDGKTPARGVMLYVYHTDVRGYYTNEAPGRQLQKPRLRGWMRTGDDGRYEFRTIRPASYPGTTAPQHIHTTLSGAGYQEYWIDSYLFEDDPHLTAEHRAKLSGRGGFQPVLTLKRDEQGVLRGVRDIRLEQV
jgi:protocatechuate 3,4-dioxygenase, beta subunit